MDSQEFRILFMICASYIDVEGSLRILGGRDALKDEFPFAVRLEVLIYLNNQEQYKRYCSGAAISSTWILTAGHCYVEEFIESKMKQFVRYNSYFPEHKGHLSALLEFHVHPRFDYYQAHNDIGLVRCEKISVLSYVTVSAADYKSFVGREAVILGFGGTNASSLSKPLQALKGMFYKCPRKEKSRYKMCVASSCEVISTICSGDSGGPVLLASSVVGVNSQSADNCNEDTKFLKRTPGASASVVEMVSPHINWIQQITSRKANTEKK